MNARERQRLLRVAIHEAGHAFASYRLGARFEYVSIVPNLEEMSAGHVQGTPWPSAVHIDSHLDSRSQSHLERHVIVLWAGPVAEKRFSGRFNWIGARGDTHAISELAWFIVDGHSDGMKAFSNWMRFKAEELLMPPYHWAGVEALAHALVEQRMIRSTDARKIIRAGMQAWLDEKTAAHPVLSLAVTDTSKAIA